MPRLSRCSFALTTCWMTTRQVARVCCRSIYFRHTQWVISTRPSQPCLWYPEKPLKWRFLDDLVDDGSTDELNLVPSMPRPGRVAACDARLTAANERHSLFLQPIIVPLKMTDNLLIGSGNAQSIGNKAISYENLDMLVIIIIYNFHWPLWRFRLADVDFLFDRYGLFVWPIWTFCLAEMALPYMVFGRICLGRYGLWMIRSFPYIY